MWDPTTPQQPAAPPLKDSSAPTSREEFERLATAQIPGISVAVKEPCHLPAAWAQWQTLAAALIELEAGDRGLERIVFQPAGHVRLAFQDGWLEVGYDPAEPPIPAAELGPLLGLIL
jgi:hypothetical protein